MQHAGPGTALAMALMAATLPGGGALAEDSATIPGGNRQGATLQRPMGENPSMRPYMSMVPAKPAAPAPAAQAAAPAAPEPRAAVLQDVDQLLRRAEADITARRLQEADTEIERAQLALRNSAEAGDPVPRQALSPMEEARQGLQRGDVMAAARGTELAQRMIAQER